MGSRRSSLLRCSPALAGLLAVLSISLFSWGLSYKLSLYHSQQYRSKIVAAKLLSEKERPVAAQSSKLLHCDLPGFAFTAAPLVSTGSFHLEPLSLFGPSPRAPSGAARLFTTQTHRRPPPNLVG